MNKDLIKAENIANEIEHEIIRGVFGPSGSRFLTVRELAAKKSISYVTACDTASILRERGTIMKYGKMHYISTGLIKKNSPLSKSITAKTGNKKRIGIHLSYINNPFFTSIVSKLQIYLDGKGYQSIIFSSEGNADIECNVLRSFLELGVQGVISFPGYAEKLVDTYNHFSLPYVFIGRTIGNIQGHSILVDNETAAYQVAEHLIKMEYKQFGYIGLEQLGNANDSRIKGYTQGLNANHTMLDARYILKVKSYDASRTSALLKQFIRKAEKPVGIFCFHDLISAQLLNICHILNLDIPDDVGIVGFDNLPIATQLTPELTTVSYGYGKMAQTAVDLLLSSINNTGSENEKYSDIYITPVLIIRDSSKKR